MVGTSALHASAGPDSPCTKPGNDRALPSLATHRLLLLRPELRGSAKLVDSLWLDRSRQGVSSRSRWERHIDLQAPVFMRPNAEQPLDQLHDSIRKFSARRLMFDKKRLVLAQLFLRRGELPLLFPE